MWDENQAKLKKQEEVRKKLSPKSLKITAEQLINMNILEKEKYLK